MATALFLHSQNPEGTAYAVGESGLTQALHDVGDVLTDINPDYVVLGEVNNYNMDQFTKAIRLIVEGAAFIATNPDANGPDEAGVVPACGAIAALIEKASGRVPHYLSANPTH